MEKKDILASVAIVAWLICAATIDAYPVAAIVGIAVMCIAAVMYRKEVK